MNSAIFLGVGIGAVGVLVLCAVAVLIWVAIDGIMHRRQQHRTSR